MAKLATLTDDFSGSPDFTKWDQASYNDNQPYVAYSAGRLRMYTTPNYAGYGAVAAYDATNSSFAFQVPTFGTFVGMQMGCDFSLPSNGVSLVLEWSTETNRVRFIASRQGDAWWDDVVQPQPGWWFRLREAAGTTFWEYSPNGGSWTTYRSEPSIAGMDTCTPVFYAGANNGDASNASRFWEIDNVNLPPSNSKAATAATSGSGTLARTVTRVTTSTTATDTGSGQLTATAAGLTQSRSTTWSATGTLTATGDRRQVLTTSAPDDGSGTLTATVRPSTSSPSPSQAVGTLAVEVTRQIAVQGTVTLGTLWLNDADNLADARQFPTLQALTVTTTRVGERRRYAAGRLRTVLRAGAERQVAVELSSLSRADLRWLESKTGALLCIRDHVGRKLYGTFLSLPVVENRHNVDGSVSVTFDEVTHSEGV